MCPKYPKDAKPALAEEASVVTNVPAHDLSIILESRFINDDNNNDGGSNNEIPDTDDINKSIIENNIDSIKNETDDHREAANFEYELGSSDGDLYNNDGVTNAITSQETRGNIDMANIGSNNNELCNVENIKIETIIKKFHHQILFCQPVNGDNNVNNQQTSHDQANDDDESWLRRAIEFEVRADNDLDNDGTTIPIESPTGLDTYLAYSI
ncbi:21413_t:CDS:2 [Entrophospora sp. SA101]|nr:21413_t:CDS:2 [Entrophospora sp. SA101]